MTDRVNDYFHLPSTRALLEHMRTEIGLSGDYLAIFDQLHNYRGSTQFHADSLNMPIKKFNDKSGIMYQKVVWELVRLAELGLQAEMRMNAESRQDTD